jgi:hypothetical protein
VRRLMQLLCLLIDTRDVNRAFIIGQTPNRLNIRSSVSRTVQIGGPVSVSFACEHGCAAGAGLDRIRCAAMITSHFPRRQAAWSRHPNRMGLIEKNVLISYETNNCVSIKIFGVLKTVTQGEKKHGGSIWPHRLTPE